jgi:nucleoside-diphosphate-sugar epimerase
MLKNLRILITGGAGAIGSNLSRSLSLHNQVVVIDDLSSGHRINLESTPSVDFIEGDILDNNVLEAGFSFSPDLVFHLAANFANQNSVDHPRKDLSVNGTGTLMILEKMVSHKVKKFIYASSSCVYGHQKVAMKEDTIGELYTPYAITKLLGEHYTRFFSTHYDLNTTILRFFNSYGPGELPGEYRNVIPNFLALSNKGESLVITGDGTESRTFTYVDDVVSAIIKSSEIPKAEGEILNISNEIETSIFELAQMINMITGNKSEIKFAPRRSWDNLLRRKPSLHKVERILNWRATTSLQTGLEKYYQWIKPYIK